jgi:hypothetical protein
MQLIFTVRTPRGYKSERSREEHYNLVISEVSWWDKVFHKKLDNGIYRIYGDRHQTYTVFRVDDKREFYLGDVPEYLDIAIRDYKTRTNIDVEAMHMKHIW